MPISSTTKVQRASREMTVQNQLGLHARPAAAFVRAVQTFRSEMAIIYHEKRYNAGRIMDLLMANLDCGATFTLEAEGVDAEAAVDRMEKLLVELRDAEARGEHS